jgi:hypothetical protein
VIDLGGVELAMANGIGVVGVVLMVGLMIMRGHLIPGKWHRESIADCHKQIEAAEARADRWEAVALKALNATEQLAEPVAVGAKVLSTIPTAGEDVST